MHLKPHDSWKKLTFSNVVTVCVQTLVYPGIGGGCSAVALPGTLDPLTLLDKVTKTALLPVSI